MEDNIETLAIAQLIRLYMSLHERIRLPFTRLLIYKVFISFIVLLSFNTIAITEEISTKKRVLLLYSYHAMFPTSPKILMGINDAFDKQKPVIDIEYMDSQRFHNLTSQKNYKTMLGYKLSARNKYDLIITANDNAFNLYLSNKQAIFKNSPAIFLGINNLEKAIKLSEQASISGVVEKVSIKKTIALSQQLQPERNNIIIICDDTTTGLADLNVARALYDDFPTLHFKEIRLNNYTWAVFTQMIAKLDKHDNILLLSAYRDQQQVHKSFRESLALIVQHTSVPIFHLWEHGLGNGILGGIVVSHYEQGRQAGLMAKAILAGHSDSTQKVILKSSNIPIFDYRQLTRFNVNMSTLPDESTVMFEPHFTWDIDSFTLNSLLFFIILFLLFFIYLVKQNLHMKKMSHELSDTANFLRLLMDTLPDPVWIKNSTGIYLACNKRFEQLYGVTENELKGHDDFDYVDNELATFFRKKDQEAIKAGKACVNEEWVTFASDGHDELFETIKSPVIDKKRNELLGILGVARDITKRKKIENDLRARELLFKTVFDTQFQFITILSPKGKVVEINDLSIITLQSKRELFIDKYIWNTPAWQPSTEGEKTWQQRLVQASEIESPILTEDNLQLKDGSIHWISTSTSAMKDDQNQLTGFIIQATDISQIKQSQEKLDHLAHHDALTGLPNRLLLKERIEQAIKHAKRHKSEFAIMFLDLDHFKHINDSLGHTYGDDLLCAVSTYLLNTVRNEDTVARIGGDEFVLVFEDLEKTDPTALLAEKLLLALHQTINLNGHEVSISASIGISIYPNDGTSTEELLRNADAAMYRAKEEGRHTYHFYSSELTFKAFERMQLANELKNAIINHEFELYYQPQIDLNTKQLIGVEALIRWQHPKRGMISPDKFIPLAEESGLILPIGKWVLETACKQMKNWLIKGIDIGRISVNVAGLQIQRAGLVQQVKEVLEANDLPASKLELEVTEGFIMKNAEATIEQLKTLRQLGVKLAIDDFGTGYSSLSYLKLFPIHKLKIDQSFVKDIPNSADDRAIAKAIIALGSSLGLTVIAEGVEQKEQAGYLQCKGCHEAQGYLYSKPMPADEFEDFSRKFFKNT
ncbi:MAG: EAL domain-containing protein [Colwellia sp.]